MSDAPGKYKKHFHDTQGQHVPPNTYLRGSKHGLVYYLSFHHKGTDHTQCLHVFEQEPDSWIKATNMARRIMLTIKGRNFHVPEGPEQAQPSALSVAPKSEEVQTGRGPRFERTINYAVHAYVNYHAQNPAKSPTDRAPVKARSHHLLRLFVPDALIEEIQGADLRKYIEVRRSELVRDSTIRRELSVLDCAIKYAMSKGRLPASFVLPPHDVTWDHDQAPREARKAKAREPDLVAQFLSHPLFPEKHRLRYLVAYNSGLRCDELIALTPSSFKPLPEGHARIILPVKLHDPSRGNDAKERGLDARTYALLMGHIAERGLGPSDTIFPRDTMIHRDVEKVWQDMGLDAPITLADLRATFGTEVALTSGMIAAKDALGHKNISTTEKYVQPGLREKVAWITQRALALKGTA